MFGHTHPCIPHTPRRATPVYIKGGLDLRASEPNPDCSPLWKTATRRSMPVTVPRSPAHRPVPGSVLSAHVTKVSQRHLTAPTRWLLTSRSLSIYSRSLLQELKFWGCRSGSSLLAPLNKGALWQEARKPLTLSSDRTRTHTRKRIKFMPPGNKLRHRAHLFSHGNLCIASKEIRL